MNHQKFIKGLLSTTVIALAISFGLSLLPQEAPFKEVIFGSLAFFIAFTIFQYMIASKAVTFKNKGAYIGIVQMLTLIKMTFTVLFIVLFVKFIQPESNWFVLPFLLNYVTFTVFETATMMRVGKA